ncbi:MAG TPA: hypothetical protein VI968_02960 [archaeon]|nr:hypothetical protein [archaeon]
MNLRTPLAIISAAALAASIEYTSAQNRPVELDYGVYQTEGKGAEIEDNIRRAAKRGEIIELKGGPIRMGDSSKYSWCVPCRKLDDYIKTQADCTTRFPVGLKPEYRAENDVHGRPVSYEGYEQADAEMALSQLGIAEIGDLPVLLDFSSEQPLVYSGFDASKNTTKDAQGGKVSVKDVLKCK